MMTTRSSLVKLVPFVVFSSHRRQLCAYTLSCMFLLLFCVRCDWNSQMCSHVKRMSSSHPFLIAFEVARLDERRHVRTRRGRQRSSLHERAKDISIAKRVTSIGSKV